MNTCRNISPGLCRYYHFRTRILWIALIVFFFSFFILAELSIHFSLTIHSNIQRAIILFYFSVLAFLIFELWQHRKLNRILKWINSVLDSSHSEGRKKEYWTKEALVDTLNVVSAGVSRENALELLQNLSAASGISKNIFGETSLFWNTEAKRLETQQLLYEKSGGFLLNSLIAVFLLSSYLTAAFFPALGLFCLFISLGAGMIKLFLYLHCRT